MTGEGEPRGVHTRTSNGRSPGRGPGKPVWEAIASRPLCAGQTRAPLGKPSGRADPAGRDSRVKHVRGVSPLGKHPQPPEAPSGRQPHALLRSSRAQGAASRGLAWRTQAALPAGRGLSPGSDFCAGRRGPGWGPPSPPGVPPRMRVGARASVPSEDELPASPSRAAPHAAPRVPANPPSPGSQSPDLLPPSGHP